MSAAPGQVQPVYLLLDISGSTVRGGFAAGRDQALPALIDAAAQRPGLRLSVLAYGTRADTLLWLTDPADIKLIPAVASAGLSSLAAGLRLLSGSVRGDAAQLAADGVAYRPPAVFVLADGLPTDPAADLLAARAELDAALTEAAAGGAAVTGATASGGGLTVTGAEGAAVTPVFAAPPGTDQLAVAGLRMTFRPLAGETPAALADSIADAFGHLIGGLPAA